MTKFILHILKPAIIAGFLILAFSCERDEPVNVGTIDCANCYQDKPYWIPLNIKVTINDENKAIPVTIYIGKIENENIDTTVYVGDQNYWIDVRPDRDYAVRAEYHSGSKTIYAVDGDHVKYKYSETGCDVPCYYQVGGYVDVRLRP